MAIRYSIIVPMRRYRREEDVLRALEEAGPTRGTSEIFVVEGNCPSRQRNAALALACGEIFVFLDNDCRPNSDYWRRLEGDLARPGVDVVGGPAVLGQGAGWNEKIFQALLAHPFLSGPVSARYVARGEFRPATQSELILCNMAVRRAVFAQAGCFNPNLHPNEENEWLERVARQKSGIYYDPLLKVSRPQRKSWGAFLFMLFRYGMGRTRQLWVGSGGLTLHQLAPLLLLAPLGAWFLGRVALYVCLGGWMAMAAVIGLTCQYLDLAQRIVAGLAAPLVPFTYALGQLGGWMALCFPHRDARDEVLVRDAEGQPLPKAAAL